MDTVQQILNEKRDNELLLCISNGSALLASLDGDIVAEYEISEEEYEQLKPYADHVSDD